MSQKSVGQITSVNSLWNEPRTLGSSHAAAKSLSFERSLLRIPGVSHTLRGVSHVITAKATPVSTRRRILLGKWLNALNRNRALCWPESKYPTP